MIYSQSLPENMALTVCSPPLNFTSLLYQKLREPFRALAHCKLQFLSLYDYHLTSGNAEPKRDWKPFVIANIPASETQWAIAVNGGRPPTPFGMRLKTIKGKSWEM